MNATRGKESFRRSLREFGPISLKVHPLKKREGEIMLIAKSPIITVAPTTPIYDGIKIMRERGFRRLPVSDPGTGKLRGIIVAMDIINYLGGGAKFQIIQRKYLNDFFKAMYEPIKTIMTEKVISTLTTSTINDAVKLMVRHNVGALPVLDKDGRVWAIVTERDVVFMFSEKMSGVAVSELMTRRVAGIDPSASIREAEETMVRYGFRRLPLISQGRLKGIITAMDIICFFGSKEIFRRLQTGTIESVLKTEVDEVAVHNLITIEPEADVGEAAKMMRDKNIGALLVTKEKRLMGIITERDLFKLFKM